MELNLPALASRCQVCGEAFVDGERVVSVLVRLDAGEAVQRFDLRVAQEKEFQPPGRVACRWVHTFKARVAGENPERELKLTAENLFMTLADPATEASADNVRLLQFLALMLERKRVLKPRGRSPDGARNVYEHAKTKLRYEVPVGELDPAFFTSVQEQLSVLVGEPKAKAPAGPSPEPLPQ
ncbi:MAG TPA: hypothetical protein VHF69_14195 [Candidatus Synoicihabitans sp.]|nr:hypothetical protein [Candidatus Synoicihabitans sp.]